MGFLTIMLLLFSLILPALASTSFRGISPQDQVYYKSATIWCRDGSKSFPAERLNDDYCDCADGTDEPGTSACSNGKFYCQNKGHTPLSIFSSRVNDGICDCCDGSDEYDGKMNCVNTCSETGKVWRDKLRRKLSIFKEGLEIRNQDIKNAKFMIENDKKELANLKQEEKKLKDIVNTLHEKKKEIEKAEEKEKVEKEKEEEARREAEKQKVNEEDTDRQRSEHNRENRDLEEDSDMDTDVDQEKDIYDDEDDNRGFDSSEQKSPEGLSKEELGRLIASRWTGENPNNEKKELEEQTYDEHVEDNLNIEQKFQNDNYEENDDDDNDVENEQEEEANDDDEHGKSKSDVQASEHEDRTEASIWSKLKSIFKPFSGMYNKPNYTVDKSEADQIRKEYHEANSKLNDIRSKISDLQKKLEQDFGKDGEFYNLYGKCFELQENKYTYKICPYKNGVQMEGHSTTTLGKWDGFKDEYRTMQFVRGDKCWNGPDRSLMVRLRCGVEIELRDVDEPSRCEYTAELLTPAVCLEERLVAIQRRLQDQGDVPHDEL